MSRRGQGGGPAPYDFRRPIKLSREHVRTLQIAFETYARSCGTLLTTRLRVVSSVTLASIEQLNYDEYVASLSNPTVIGVVDLDPLPGTALMEMSSSAVMTAIDHMLGGPGGRQPERPLTEVEMPLLRGLLERMLGELRYGFEQLVDISPKLKEIEYNAQFLRAHAPGDACVTHWYVCVPSLDGHQRNAAVQEHSYFQKQSDLLQQPGRSGRVLATNRRNP